MALSDIIAESAKKVAQNYRRPNLDEKKPIHDAEAVLSVRAQENSSEQDIYRNLTSVTGSPGPVDISIENLAHWYILADPERRLAGLILNPISNLKLKYEVSKLKSQEQDDVSQTADYPKASDFFKTVLTTSDEKFKLQYRYMFAITIDFGSGKYRSPGKLNGGAEPALDYMIDEYAKNNTLALLAQNAVLPNITGDEPIRKINEFGYMSMPSNRIVPDNNEFRIFFLSTELPVFETLMYEWLKQTACDTYIYIEQPFRKAKVYVDFMDQRQERITFRYIFHGVYPRSISTIDPDHDGTTPDLSRDVAFLFDYMTIETVPWFKTRKYQETDSGRKLDTSVITNKFNRSGYTKL